MANHFDRMLGMLEGLPDVIHAKPTTIRDVVPLTGDAQTFIVQMVKQKDRGETVFLEHVSAEGTIRIVLPPKVIDTIVRQRDALSGQARSRAAKAQAAERKAAGIEPGFLRKQA